MIPIGGLVLERMCFRDNECHLSNNLLTLNIGEISQVALVAKNPLASAGDIRDMGLIPGLGRFSGGGNGNPV